MKHQIVFEINCGDKTCAHEKGKFCQFLGTKSFGTKFICTLFDNEVLFDGEDGWLQRCPKCLATAKPIQTDGLFELIDRDSDKLYRFKGRLDPMFQELQEAFQPLLGTPLDIKKFQEIAFPIVSKYVSHISWNQGAILDKIAKGENPFIVRR